MLRWLKCKSLCAQVKWFNLAKGEGKNIFGRIIIGLKKKLVLTIREDSLAHLEVKLKLLELDILPILGSESLIRGGLQL